VVATHGTRLARFHARRDAAGRADRFHELTPRYGIRLRSGTALEWLGRDASSYDLEDSLAWARAQDAADELAPLRGEFLFPESGPLYFAGHSLGLQPRRAREYVLQEMDDWARFGVEGHFAARNPWVSYHELLTASTARLVGALPHEVVVMNTLSVNLHLMMVSFYRPAPRQAPPADRKRAPSPPTSTP